MAAPFGPRRRITQPQQGARIDRANPLAQGLVLCAIVVDSGFYDLISGQVVTHPGTMKVRPPGDGNRQRSIAALGTGASGGKFTNRTGLDEIVGPFSLFVEGSMEVNASTQTMCMSRDPSTGKACGVKFDDNAVIFDGFIYYAENGNQTNSGSNVLPANSEKFAHRIMITADGVNSKFYCQRNLVKTAATAVLPTSNVNRRTTMCGSDGTQ